MTLSDRDHVSTYCILDATLPMRRYVATVQLKRVTDGERTFWHWQSTFEVPRGREREFADLVGQGRVRRRLRGLRAYLRAARSAGRAAVARRLREASLHAVVVARFGGPGSARRRPRSRRPRRARARCASARRAIGVNYIDVYVRTRPVPHDRAARAAGHGSGGRRGRRRRRRGASAAGRSRRVCVPAARRLCRRAHARRGSGRGPARRHRRRDGRCADAEGHDRRVPAASHASRARGRNGARACRRRRRGAAAVPVGEGARRARDRHGVERGQGAARARARLRATSSSRATAGSPTRSASDRRPRRGRHLRRARREARGREPRRARAVRPLDRYGQAGGPLDPLDPAALCAKSATLSRPVLFHYTAQRAALRGDRRATRSKRCAAARCAPTIRHRYPLAAAADAHRDLEARRTVGALVLLA